MKRMVLEIWVTDEATMPDQEVLDEMIGEDVLGVRATLTNGDVLRAGETFG